MKLNSFPSVDIVVCSYKHRELTLQCIDSLLKLSYPNFKIILVDDYSNDGTVEFLRNKYPNITILENKRNLNITKARNVGINNSRSKYIVTVDSDAILTTDWINKAMELMESDERIGQIAGKILMFNEPQKIAAAGGSMYFRGKAYDLGYEMDVNDKKYNQQREVLYACSASSIIRHSALNQVNGFSDIYHQGYEDADFSLRLNVAGYKIVYCPEAISYHVMRRNIDAKIINIRTAYAIRNRLLIMLRNYELKSLFRYLPKNLFFTIKDCWRHPKRIWSVIKSWFWIIFHLPSIISGRRKINHYRKTTDKQLEHLFNLD